MINMQQIDLTSEVNSSDSFKCNSVTKWITSLRRNVVRRTIVVKLSAIIFISTIPLVHFGVINKLWDDFKVTVDRDSCICSCWDTGFKAKYETGTALYHHVYFNLTSNSAKILICSIFFFISFYEISNDIYPHYYAWWSFFNYWNDDFYLQWNHQFLFTVSESVSTGFIVSMLDSSKSIELEKLLCIIAIAISHILASGTDQFFKNIFQGEGELHQILRDFGLFLPDIFHVIIPIILMKGIAKEKRMPTTHLVNDITFISILLYIVIFWFTCAFIL